MVMVDLRLEAGEKIKVDWKFSEEVEFGGGQQFGKIKKTLHTSQHCTRPTTSTHLGLSAIPDTFYALSLCSFPWLTAAQIQHGINLTSILIKLCCVN